MPVGVSMYLTANQTVNRAYSVIPTIFMHSIATDADCQHADCEMGVASTHTSHMLIVMYVRKNGISSILIKWMFLS